MPFCVCRDVLSRCRLVMRRFWAVPDRPLEKNLRSGRVGFLGVTAHESGGMNTLESSMNGPTSEEETLFDAARRLTNPAQRQAFIDAVCAEDPALRLRL